MLQLNNVNSKYSNEGLSAKSSITWKYGKPLKDTSELTSVEKALNIVFPKEYKELVTQNNGGSPDKQAFKINGSEKVFNYLIKVKQIQSYTDSIRREYDADKNIIPFADDPSGNFICFDFTSKTSPKIVYFETDLAKALHVASNFNAFLKMLY